MKRKINDQNVEKGDLKRTCKAATVSSSYKMKVSRNKRKKSTDLKNKDNENENGQKE